MQTYPVEQKKMTASELFFHILLILVWAQHTVWAYLVLFVAKLPIIGQVYKYILPFLIITAVLMSLPYIIKKAKPSDLLFFIACTLLVLFSYVFYPENQSFIVDKLGKIFLYTLPMYFLGVSYTHEKYKKTLYWASLASLAVKFAYQMYLFSIGDLIGTYNMDAAYQVLPSVMFLILWALEKQGVRNWLVAAFGIFLVLTYGTRGPILAILIFLCIGIYVRTLRSQKRYARMIFIISAVIIIILFSSPSISTIIFEQLSKWFESIGFSTRIFDFILGGKLAESTERNALTERVIAAIGERPFLGYGIMGDRVILNELYCHNIFWEFICDFGVIFGAVFFGILVWLFAKAIKSASKNNYLYLTLMVVTMMTTKLFLSGSYIQEPYFFFALGICVSAIRKKVDMKRNKEELSNENDF